MVDKKLTELDAITAVTTDDLLYVVDAPGSSPVSKKITVANFIKINALVFLEEHTASDSATLDFVNISALYDDYVLEIDSISPASDDVTLLLRVGTGGGPTYQETNYTWANYFHNQASGEALGGASGATAITLLGNCGNASMEYSSGSIKIRNLNSTSFHKDFSIQVGGIQYSGNFTAVEGSARWISTTAVTALRLLYSSGNISGGTTRLYGISKA